MGSVQWPPAIQFLSTARIVAEDSNIHSCVIAAVAGLHMQQVTNHLFKYHSQLKELFPVARRSVKRFPMNKSFTTHSSRIGSAQVIHLAVSSP